MQQLNYVGARALEWREVARPRLDSDQAAIVRPTVVSTCDADGLFIAAGVFRGPVPVGHEGLGVVEEVGDVVRSVTPGDVCLMPWKISCATCRACTLGLTAQCTSVPREAAYGWARRRRGGAASSPTRCSCRGPTTCSAGFPPAPTRSPPPAAPTTSPTAGARSRRPLPSAPVAVCSSSAAAGRAASASTPAAGRAPSAPTCCTSTPPPSAAGSPSATAPGPGRWTVACRTTSHGTSTSPWTPAGPDPRA